MILGAGPAGIAAALAGSAQGLRVTLIGGGEILGDGLHGVYKSKGMWELARDRVIARRAGFGYAPSGGEVHFREIQQQLNAGVEELTRMYLRYLEVERIEYVRGFARFVSPFAVEVDGRVIEGDRLIIATGSSPRVLPDVEVDGKRIMTSDHVVDVDESFGSLLVIGAGVVGCEFTSIFSALGVSVTLLDRTDRLLSSEDPDVGELLATVYQRNGVDIRPGACTRSVRVRGEKVVTELEDGLVIVSDRVLLSVGRIAPTEGLNLAAAGVRARPDGVIPVNESLQTNVSHIYAVGDVGERNTPVDIALAHVADAEGRMAVKHIRGEEIRIHPEYVPFIIFTMPMIAGAGLTEMHARERDPGVRVAKFLNARNHRYHAMRSFEGFVKLIVGRDGDDRILGVRAVGEQADNIIAEVAVLIDNRVPYTYLLDSLQAHPSLGESLQNAARMIAGVLPET